MQTQQKRVVRVLERMIDLAVDDFDTADLFSDKLDALLDDLAEDDFFGTEQQLDPRGDGREGVWSMWTVEGIDS